MLIYTPRMRPQLWPNSVVTSANYTADLRIDYAATAGEALAMTDSTVDRNALRYRPHSEVHRITQTATGPSVSLPQGVADPAAFPFCRSILLGDLPAVFYPIWSHPSSSRLLRQSKRAPCSSTAGGSRYSKLFSPTS